MPKQSHITFQPLTLDLEQAGATLQVPYKLIEQLETAYCQALREQQ